MQNETVELTEALDSNDETAEHFTWRIKRHLSQNSKLDNTLYSIKIRLLSIFQSRF